MKKKKKKMKKEVDKKNNNKKEEAGDDEEEEGGGERGRSPRSVEKGKVEKRLLRVKGEKFDNEITRR